jgi:N-formylmaleamate deformylase
MKSEIFKIDDISLNYYQTGQGQPDLFVQHGLYDDGLCWGNLPRDLGKRFRVSLMDARGFGYSSKPESGYEMDTMTEDMVSFIMHLGLINPIVIGHSMGASLGCHLAALHPDLLSGVVLIDPAFRETSCEIEKEDLISKRVNELLAQQAMTQDQLISSIRAKHPD